MKYNRPGNSGLNVSEICLGTMNWGMQNSEAEGHAQMDDALDHRVNFFDSAEMYPAPIQECLKKCLFKATLVRFGILSTSLA